MNPAALKVAAFTVKADARQSARWKRTAESEGFPSVGSWAALALDAYVELRAKGDLPVPLVWDRRRFPVNLGGKVYQVKGHTSPPFGSFKGTVDRPVGYKGGRSFVLLYLPTFRVLATLESFQRAKALASLLARTWVRWEGEGEPPGHRPEDTINRR